MWPDTSLISQAQPPLCGRVTLETLARYSVGNVLAGDFHFIQLALSRFTWNKVEHAS